MNVKERVKKFIEHKKLPISKFEEMCDLSNGYISAMRKGFGQDKLNNVLSVFPELNREWLLYGEGEMLKPQQPSVQQNNYNGNGNYVVVGNNNQTTCDNCGANISTLETEEVQAAPFVPESLAVRPGIDVVEELEKREGELELSPIRTEMPITCWYRMIDDSLYPDYKLGENLALLAYPQGKEKPIPGKAYVVQTESNGMIPRILFPEGCDFKARSLNPDKYPDFTIERDDVVWIFKILFAVRR
jgi:hypothetical protein